MGNRKRPIAKRIWFSEDEWSKVEAKMGQAGAINFSAFTRRGENLRLFKSKGTERLYRPHCRQYKPDCEAVQ